MFCGAAHSNFQISNTRIHLATAHNGRDFRSVYRHFKTALVAGSVAAPVIQLLEASCGGGSDVGVNCWCGDRDDRASALSSPPTWSARRSPGRPG